LFGGYILGVVVGLVRVLFLGVLFGVGGGGAGCGGV